MTVERLVVIAAGFFIMASVALSHFHSPYWLWFTAFVGANLFQSGLTGFCPLAIILKKFGILTESQKATMSSGEPQTS